MVDHSNTFDSNNCKFAEVDDLYTQTKFATTPMPAKMPTKKLSAPSTPVTGLFNTNKNPKLCRRKNYKIDFNTVEKQLSKPLESADDYQNYLAIKLLNPDGFRNINKKEPKTLQCPKDLYDDIWDGPARANYFDINTHRSARNKKLASIFSKNTRRYERDDALLDDSFGSQLRSFDAGPRSNTMPENEHLTLEDQFDLVTESALDIRNL
jgi:hypothetical protein